MHRSRFGLLALGLFSFGPATLRADAGADTTKVVVRVGSLKVTEGELARELTSLDPRGLARYGTEEKDAKLGYVDGALVPRLLWAQEAERRHLTETDKVRDRVRESLRQSLEDQLLAEAAAPSEGELKAYYEAHRELFHRPFKVRVWRIVVRDESVARRILEQCRGADGISKWRQFAREHSLDKATALRGGDLGFVHENGSTDAPEVRVSPEVYNAALALADGELATEPVASSHGYTAIWRRGSIKAEAVPLAEAREFIESQLRHQRAAAERKRLLADLRRKHSKKHDSAPLDRLRLPPSFAGAGTASAAKPRAAEGPVEPTPEDRVSR